MLESYKPLKTQRAKYKLESAIDRKAKRINVQRPLGIWERLRVYGTPEEIKEELRFSQQKASIKKCQTEIKSLLNDLKK